MNISASSNNFLTFDTMSVSRRTDEPNGHGNSSNNNNNNNGERFIDINIDSDAEDPKPANQTTTSKSTRKHTLFKFGSKSKSTPLVLTPTKKKTDVVNNTLTQKTELLLANLSEIGINSRYKFDDFDDDDDDEDEEDEKEAAEEKLKDETILKSSNESLRRRLSMQLLDSVNNQELTKRNSTSSNTTTPTNGQLQYQQQCDLFNSTPLNFTSLDCFDPMLDASLDTTVSLDTTLDNNNNNDKPFSISKNEQLLQPSFKPLLRSSSMQVGAISTNSMAACKKASPSLLKQHAQRSQALMLKNTTSLNFSMRNDSLVDGLLGDIYDRFNVSLRTDTTLDSDVFTTSEFSASSSRLSGGDSHESENSKMAKSHLHHLSMLFFLQLTNY
jgi:hypothetical protein